MAPIALAPIAVVVDDIVATTIAAAVALASNQVNSGGPPPQHLPTIDWAHIAGILNNAYPGYTQPTKYDQQTVAILMAEMIAHIAGETQGEYYGEIALANAVGTLQAIVAGLQNQVRSLAGTEVSRTTVQALANQVAALGRTVSTDYAAAVNHANQLYNLEQQNLGAAYNRLIATIATEYTTAIHYAQQLYNMAVAYTNQVQAQETAYVQGVYNRTQANLGAAVNGLRENLGAEQNARIAGDSTVLHEAVSNTTAQVGLASSAATAFTLKQVGQLSTQVQSQLAKVNTDLETCLDPLCDTVTPNAKQLGNLGKLLTGLADDALYGLLLTFFVECVADPHAAAVEVDTVIGPIAGAAAAGMRDLLRV